MRQRILALAVGILWLLCISSAGAQEKVIVSHTTRGSLSTIDEAKSVTNITKPISHADIVDYSFLRTATKSSRGS